MRLMIADQYGRRWGLFAHRRVHRSRGKQMDLFIISVAIAIGIPLYIGLAGIVF